MPQSFVSPGLFVARTAESLTQQMIDYFVAMQTDVTDLSTGSVIRTELESMAELAEQFYVDLASTLQDAIIQSAYTAFNFTQNAYSFATGYLEFIVVISPLSDLTFLSGSKWQPQSLDFAYQTTATLVIPSGTLIGTVYHVPARCSSPGIVGNIEPGITGNLLYPIPEVSVISEDGTNNTGTIIGGGSFELGFPYLQLGFTNGVDPETPLEMRTRFTSFLSSLHRSTADALEYGATLAKLTDVFGAVTEQVAQAKTIDVNNDPILSPILERDGVTPYPCQFKGDVRVFIYNGRGSPNGQITSDQLRQKTQSIIDGSLSTSGYVPGYKAAGMPTYVEVADEYIMNTTIQITRLGSGTSTAVSWNFLKQAIAGPGGALDNFFKSFKIGDKFYVSALVGAISQVPGVKSVDIIGLTIKRQYDSVIVSGSVVDYEPPLNGIIIADQLSILGDPSHLTLLA